MSDMHTNDPGRRDDQAATITGVLSSTPCNNNVLRKATRHLGQLFDDVIGASGLRAGQHGLLHHIKEMGGPTIKELAQILVMDLSALGHTLKPLVRDGFIVLTPDPRDKRAKRITLTGEGEAKLAETRRLWRVAQGRVETALGPEKSLQMREMLEVIASKEFGDAFRGERPLADGAPAKPGRATAQQP